MSMRLMIALAILFGLPAVLPSAAQAQDRGRLQLMPCNSWDYRPARCSVNLSRGGAAYLRQVVAGRCGQLGTNWGWDSGGVWVRNGCRAIFAIQYGGGDFPVGVVGPAQGAGRGWRQVRCESFQYRQARCATDILGPPHLQQVIAGQCVRGETWDYDRGGINVRGGCRAIFSVPAGYPGGYPGR